MPCNRVLGLRVREVSDVNHKGKHTTTTAELENISESGGWVVDTPGVRRFSLWDTPAGEVEGFFLRVSPLRGACAPIPTARTPTRIICA